MNYLAHAFLSRGDKDLLIGNFIADHIRGNNFNGFDEKVIQGVFLHRKIDSFTDSHPLFKNSKRLFYDGFEKYSGILVDIYFDHLLAKNFEHYHEQSLSVFSENVYKVYNTYQAIIPESSSRFLQYVTKNNIYNTYADLEGIERVLGHLSQRIRHGIRLDDSITLFKRREEEIQNNFNQFFKDALIEFKPLDI